jgi:hypothetical protein
MVEEPKCTLAEGFSVWEKAWAQISFWVTGIVGTVGIVLTDWPWVIPYIVIYWYGVPGIIMRHLNCPRCPHLHVYGDCVQAPASLTRWLVKQRKSTPYSKVERFLFYAIFILIPTYPLFWLATHMGLLVAFVIAAAAWYSGQWLYLCKRCRVYSCPFNRVPVARRASEVGAWRRINAD